MASKLTTNSLKRPHDDDLVTAQEKLLRQPISSDLTIICGEKIWKCQSAILSQRCDFFRIACTGPYRESATRVLNLEADDAEAVDMLLVYLYTLDVPVNFSPQKGTFDDAEHAYIIGDKYQLPVLKLAGYEYMMASITKMLEASKLRQDSAAVGDWTAFVAKLWEKDFPDAAHFKDVVLVRIVKASRYFIKDNGFQELLERNKEFNRDFIAALVRYIGKG